ARNSSAQAIAASRISSPGRSVSRQALRSSGAIRLDAKPSASDEARVAANTMRRGISQWGFAPDDSDSFIACFHQALPSIDVLKADERALHDSRQRVGGDLGRNPGPLAQPLIQTSQERAAPAQHHAAIHKVADQIRAAGVERGADRFENSLERLIQGGAKLSG